METTTTQQPTTFKVTTQVEIPVRRIADLLCCAFEGGSNYWCHLKVKKAPDEFAFRYMPDLSDKPCSYTDYPTNKGGYIIVGDSDGDMPDGVVNLNTLHLGLQVMAEKYPHHWKDFVDDNEDATTGDVFLQCVLWSEIVFG